MTQKSGEQVARGLQRLREKKESSRRHNSDQNGPVSKLHNFRSLRWRTGRNPKAGKIIRKDKDGFDRFEDYFTESDRTDEDVTPVNSPSNGEVESHSNENLSRLSRHTVVEERDSDCDEDLSRTAQHKRNLSSHRTTIEEKDSQHREDLSRVSHHTMVDKRKSIHREDLSRTSHHTMEEERDSHHKEDLSRISHQAMAEEREDLSRTSHHTMVEEQENHCKKNLSRASHGITMEERDSKRNVDLSRASHHTMVEKREDLSRTSHHTMVEKREDLSRTSHRTMVEEREDLSRTSHRTMVEEREDLSRASHRTMVEEREDLSRASPQRASYHNMLEDRDSYHKEDLSRTSHHTIGEERDQGNKKTAETNAEKSQENQNQMEKEKMISSLCNVKSPVRRKSSVVEKSLSQQAAESEHEYSDNKDVEDNGMHDSHEHFNEKSNVTDREELDEKDDHREKRKSASTIKGKSIEETRSIAYNKSIVRTENLDTNRSVMDAIYKKLRGQSVQRIVLESDDNGSLVIDDDQDVHVFKLSGKKHEQMDNARTRKSLADRLRKRKGKSLGNVNENQKEAAEQVRRRKSTLTGKKKKDVVEVKGWSDEEGEEVDSQGKKESKSQKAARKSSRAKENARSNMQEKVKTTKGRKKQVKETKTTKLSKSASQKTGRKGQAIEKSHDVDDQAENENSTDSGTSNSGEENLEENRDVTKGKNCMVDMPHGKSVLTASNLDVAGSNIGSITKLDNATIAITPSFRTRKRLSYSVADLDERQNLKKRMSSIRARSSVDSIEEEAPLDDVESGNKTNQQKSVGKNSSKFVWLRDTESESSVTNVSLTRKSGDVQKTDKSRKSTDSLEAEDGEKEEKSVYDISPDKDEVIERGGKKKGRNQSRGKVKKDSKSSRSSRGGPKGKKTDNVKKKSVNEEKTSPDDEDKGEDDDQNRIHEDQGKEEMESPLHVQGNSTKTRSKQILLDSDTENDIEDDRPENLPFDMEPIENNEQSFTEHFQDSDEKSKQKHQSVGKKRNNRSAKSKAKESCSDESDAQSGEPQSLPRKTLKPLKKGSKSAKSRRTKVQTATKNKKRRHTEVGMGTEVLIRQEDTNQQKIDTPQRDFIADSQTPTGTVMTNEDIEAQYKSGISFRHSRRRTLNDLAEQGDLAETTVNPVGLSPPKNRRLTDVASTLTPILSKGSSQKKNKRRVTISNLVKEKTYQVHADTSGNSSSYSIGQSSTPHGVAPRFSMDSNASDLLSMNATPVHIYEVTTSQTPEPPVPMPKIPKLILPEEPHDGLRRSNRVRCRPVASYKGERVIYERRKSGLGIIGIQPSAVEIKVLKMEAERKRKHRKIKKGNKGRSPRRNLSTHVALDPDLSLSSESECEVIDHATGNIVTRTCMFSKDQQVFHGPTNRTPVKSDPFIMTVTTANDHFISGVLILRPLKEKPRQLVSKGSMTFLILKGKVSFTIHETTLIGEAEDLFCVPKGNTYSIQNLRKEEAKLSFQCVLHD
ncbi:hypothetical protein FSP39_015694 [Pinctada imbricata]|uniref:Mif2/CENP-C cupin domain-containing protein n=1 Tax=Pinctada imbricata TaxID=66713 RepID=A0AA88XSJ2_PINIB|nr:hypothetical protein FSP39_015694 [Pinctada imbricata]